MGKILLLIAGTVVAINLVYVLLPSGNLEKYSRHIFGLILILIFAGTITNIEISSNILDFNNKIPVYNDDNIEETINNQTEKLIENRIEEHLLSNGVYVENIQVFLEEKELNCVSIIAKNQNEKEKIYSLVSAFCNVEKEKIFVE